MGDEQAKAERRPLGTWILNLVEDFQSKKLVLLEDRLWPDVHFCVNLKGDNADAFDKRILRLAPPPIFVYGSFVLSGIFGLACNVSWPLYVSASAAVWLIGGEPQA
jgi:hypothetical protein